jgi:hypothetical protein
VVIVTVTAMATGEIGGDSGGNGDETVVKVWR